MFFPRDKEDDDDEFTPKPNHKSKLSSIFSSMADSSSSSLTYTSPKQPKGPSKAVVATVAAAATRTGSVIIATTVQTFKMVGGEYESQGRLGAAVSRTCADSQTTYQLILYRDKHNYICVARISRDFKFAVQSKHYASFYDKNSFLWSIMFNNKDDMVEFTKKVALARWRAGPPNTPFMIQDLWRPESAESDTGPAVGDTVELMYSLHDITITTQGLVDSVRLDVEVEDKGWKQALIGLGPTCERIVILQPAILGDLNPEHNLYLGPVIAKLSMVSVLRKAASFPLHSDKSDSASLEDCSSVQTKPALLTTKADLISRMARMGFAVPFKSSLPPPSDSDEPEEDRSVASPVPRLKPRPRNLSAAPPFVEPTTVTTHLVPCSAMPPQYTIYPTPQMENQSQLNIFLSEVRTTNSELRMGITRLTDKVDALQSKVSEKVQPANADMVSMMERLLDSEQQLRLNLLTVLNTFPTPSGSRESSAESSSAQAQYSTALINRPCEKCAADSHDIAPLTERIKKLEEENEFLKTTTTAQKEALQNAKYADQNQMKRIEELQRLLTIEETRVSDLNEKLKSSSKEVENLKDDLQKKVNSLADLQKVVLEKQLCIDKLEETVKDCEAPRLDEVRRNLQEVMDPWSTVSDHLKKLLNTVYKFVKVQFEPQTMYESSTILSILAEVIKGVTVEYLQDGAILTATVSQSSGGTANLQGTPHVNQALNEDGHVKREPYCPVRKEIKDNSHETSDTPITHNDVSVTSNNTES